MKFGGGMKMMTCSIRLRMLNHIVVWFLLLNVYVCLLVVGVVLGGDVVCGY